MNHRWDEIVAEIPGFLAKRFLQPEIVVGFGLSLVPLTVGWFFSNALQGMLG